MGCLKFIIKVVIVVFAIIGFKSVGGWDWCVKTFHLNEKPTQESMIEKSKDVADFSNIPDEYEIAKSANVFGYRAVIAHHDATGQKFAVVNEKKGINLTKEDFKKNLLEDKEICEILSNDEIENCFDSSYYLRNIEEIYSRFGI